MFVCGIIAPGVRKEFSVCGYMEADAKEDPTCACGGSAELLLMRRKIAFSTRNQEYTKNCFFWYIPDGAAFSTLFAYSYSCAP